MKTYKLNIDVFVFADDEAEATINLVDEMDYLCRLDNNIQAYTHPSNGTEEAEGKTA